MTDQGARFPRSTTMHLPARSSLIGIAVLALACLLPTGGCSQRSSSDWAQTAPSMAQLQGAQPILGANPIDETLVTQADDDPSVHAAP